MMPVDRHGIEWVRGDDYEVPFHFTNSDGTDRDISGWTVYFTVKRNIDDPDSEALISVDNTSHENPSKGRTTVVVPNADTDGLNGTYVYDAQYRKPDGIVKTFIQGTITVHPDVTRRI